MKFVIILTILFYSNANAAMFKCTIEGKTTYQDSPCQELGGTGAEITLETDTSVTQQEQAQIRYNKLKSILTKFDNMEQQRIDAWDKERKIIAEEEKARAARENAEYNRRQAEALEKRNAAGLIY